jgi:hypothetical protein
MATALFTTGDIFERGADLTVLPCSAAGHISRTAEKHVVAHGLPRPEAMELGSIAVHPFPGGGRDARWIAWAASVMHYASSAEIIARIGRALGQYANDHPEAQILESPLLGTGAGHLDPLIAGPALKDGFEEVCVTDAHLFIYGQLTTTINQLREISVPQNMARLSPRPPAAGRPIEIFFSYAHEDEDLMDEVRRQLVVHERNGRILKWHDRKILAGADWRFQIDDRLNRANIVLIFLSPHYIDSKFCYEIEGQAALQRHAAGEAVAIPIILRPCPWQHSPYASIQALPRDGRPVSRWDDRDEASLEVADGVMAVVDDLISRSVASSRRQR